MSRRFMARSIEPTSLSVSYNLEMVKAPGAVNTGASWCAFVNLADGLSMQNRRLYRRNYVYSVDSVDHQLLIGGNDTYTIQVIPLPCTYSVLQACDRAERAWDEMNDQVTEAIDFEESESADETKARWSDFAMDMIKDQDTYQGQGTVALQVIPITDNNIGAPGTAGAALYTEVTQVDGSNKAMSLMTSGEKVRSKFQTPEGEAGVAHPNAYDEFFMTCIGGHDGVVGARTTVSALKSYLDTRIDPGHTNQEPGIAEVQTDPLVNLFTNLDTYTEIAEHLTGDGNRPPYPDNDEHTMISLADQALLPPSVATTSISSTSAPSGVRSTGGFLAPHGWVMMIIHSPDLSLLEFARIRTTFNCTPGTYRGTAAEHVGRF